MPKYQCPPQDDYDHPQGCGLTFEQDGPDDEGFVDCPHCGLFFRPLETDATEKEQTR